MLGMVQHNILQALERARSRGRPARPGAVDGPRYPCRPPRGQICRPQLAGWPMRKDLQRLADEKLCECLSTLNLVIDERIQLSHEQMLELYLLHRAASASVAASGAPAGWPDLARSPVWPGDGPKR